MSSSMTRWACSGVRRWMLPGRGRGPSLVLVATQSAPAQKSTPVLPITMARSESSTAASSSARTIRVMAGTCSAFLRSGRSSRMCNTRSEDSTTTPSAVLMIRSLRSLMTT